MRPKGRRPEGRLSAARPAASQTQLYTVGHSTRSLDELVDLLRDYGITQLVDVRHYPMSRRNPQFNLDRLESELPARGITYVWAGEQLGGFRKGGYLDYMATPAFAQGIARLEVLVKRATTAIMCAEIVWFRCHRRFIAREMVARGYRVTHIVTRGKPTYDEPLPITVSQPRIRAEWSGGEGDERGPGTSPQQRLSSRDRRRR